jgi:hypothetical protein
LSKKTPLYRKPWEELTPYEKHRRQIYVDIIREVRRGKMSLTTAAKHRHVRPGSVVGATNAFRKVGRFWVVKKSDHLSVSKNIYVKSRELSIVTNDSRERRKIGRYFNAVYKLYKKGETEPLLKLKGLTVKDSQGNTYTLDTDPDRVLEILRRREEGEFKGPNSG